MKKGIRLLCVVYKDMSATDHRQLAFYPIEYPALEKFYQKLKDTFWTPQEISFATDRDDWDKLDEDSKRAVKFNLLFFAQADRIVIDNIVARFQRDTDTIKEASAFYCMQNANEMIHNETYSMLIETLIRDEEEKQRAFNAIENFESVKRIADWMFYWLASDRPLLERVIAFAFIEYSMFPCAFCIIYWIKRRNILPGLCKANEFIARDEAIHAEFAVTLFHTLVSQGKPRPSETEARDVIRSGVDTAEVFIRDSLPKDLVGLNADGVLRYTKCTANVLAKALGYEPLYEVTNPFEWMNLIALSNMSNFFETKVSEYSKMGGDQKYIFTTEAEF